METILVFVLAVGFIVSIAANIYQNVLRSRDAKEFLQAHNHSNQMIISMHEQQTSDMMNKFRELEELSLIEANEKRSWTKMADRRHQILDKKYEQMDPNDLFGNDQADSDAEYFQGNTRGKH